MMFHGTDESKNHSRESTLPGYRLTCATNCRDTHVIECIQLFLEDSILTDHDILELDMHVLHHRVIVVRSNP